MNTKWILPKNIEDSLPPESEFLDSLSQSIKSIFKSYGFHFIIPPSIEFLDLLNSLEKDHQNNNNYFITYDNNSNTTLAFRSDITVQLLELTLISFQIIKLINFTMKEIFLHHI